MTNDENSAMPWPKIIIGIIIFALLMLWFSARNENQLATQEFVMLTARAENQNAISAAATQEIADKIRGCIGINEVARSARSNQCVVGFLAYAKDTPEPKIDSSEPDLWLTYFDFMPNTFYLYGLKFLGGYVGDCVMVWGKIQLDQGGTPILGVNEDQYGEANIEKLPDDVCRP